MLRVHVDSARHAPENAMDHLPAQSVGEGVLRPLRKDGAQVHHRKDPLALPAEGMARSATGGVAVWNWHGVSLLRRLVGLLVSMKGISDALVHENGPNGPFSEFLSTQFASSKRRHVFPPKTAIDEMDEIDQCQI